MALNQPRVTRFSRRLTRELSIDGEMPTPVVAPEIQPVIILENERPELLHLAREHRFACTLTLAAVAAEYYYFHLWNDSLDNLVVVENLVISNGSAGNPFDFGPANPTFKASLSGRAADTLDQRIPASAIGRPCVANPLVGTDPNTGGILGTWGRSIAPAATNHNLPRLDYIVMPGQGFGVFGVVVNQIVYGCCIWRERAAEDGELT